MSGNEEQSAIMDAELYWYGGGLSAPKVYDTGTNFHASPTLRDTSSENRSRAARGPAKRPRRFRAYFNDSGVWTVEVTQA